MVRRPGVKEGQPVAWLMAVRYTLSLGKSPNAAVRQRVLEKWRAAPDDPELTAYLECDRRFGPLLQYEPEPAVKPLRLAAKF